MGNWAGKHKKSSVHHMRYISKLNCLIRNNGHSLEHCKILNDFSTRYYAKIPVKERSQDPTAAKKCKKKSR